MNRIYWVIDVKLPGDTVTRQKRAENVDLKEKAVSKILFRIILWQFFIKTLNIKHLHELWQSELCVVISDVVSSHESVWKLVCVKFQWIVHQFHVICLQDVHDCWRHEHDQWIQKTYRHQQIYRADECRANKATRRKTQMTRLQVKLIRNNQNWQEMQQRQEVKLQPQELQNKTGDTVGSSGG